MNKVITQCRLCGVFHGVNEEHQCEDDAKWGQGFQEGIRSEQKRIKYMALKFIERNANTYGTENLEKVRSEALRDLMIWIEKEM